MIRPLDRPLAAVFFACQDYFLTNGQSEAGARPGEAYKRVKKALTEVLRAMAAIHAVKYTGWKADRTHPGYLARFEPPMHFLVPYHVLPAFPSGEELQALWSLSRAIRSGNRSVISISGSNVLRKVFDLVGDIDFCEYLPVSDVDGFAQIASNLDGNAELACLRLAMQEKEWRFPWGEDRPKKEDIIGGLNHLDENMSTLKVDYVGEVETIGVAEISNIVIAVGDDGYSAGLKKTFAAQEAPLVPVDWLPNQMNDPVEMGRYIYFLTESMLALASKKDMCKCLKRCASLSRVIFTPEITDDVMRVSLNSAVMIDRKLRELEKVQLILGALNDGRSHYLTKRLATQVAQVHGELSKRGGVPDEFARARFDKEVRDIMHRLLRCVRPTHPDARRVA